MSKKSEHNDHHQAGQQPQPHQQPQGYYGVPPEYGYRPVEEDEIDLVELFQTFWSERILIAKIVGAFLILGLLVALFSPKEYSTSATLMPEAQSSQGAASSLLNQYGGLLGIGGGAASTGQEGTIPPQVYPNIVESVPYQVELMSTEIYFSEYDTTVTVHDFFSEIYSPSVLGYAKQFTIGLPGQIIGLFKASEEGIEGQLPQKVNRDSVLSLSKEQMGTVKTMKARLIVNVSQETGMITFSGRFPDPQATAEIVHSGIDILKKYVREYKTQKALEDLKFVKEQVDSAKKRFEEVQNRLAKFRDSNLNLTTAKAQTREQELQSQYDLTYNLYNSLSQRLEQKKLQVQEQTPVFTVLQPVSVPIEKSSPKRLFILIVSGVIGLLISLGWLFLRIWWHKEQLRFE